MPGEHKVHPYLHLETLCRGSVNILYSTGHSAKLELLLVVWLY